MTGYTPKWGHTGPHSFWKSPNGRVELYRWCDGVFELFCDSVSVMPTGSFERLLAYMKLEFPEACVF